MKKFLAAACLSLMLASTAAFAVPSVQQIESAMSQGNWQQADSGLTQVLEAHPNNAHAHYLYGQVLDREGRSGDALAQIQQAKALDPQIRFTDPTRFAQTEARIRRNAEQRAGGAPTNSTGGNSFAQQNTAFAPQASQSHGPSTGSWIGIALLIAAIAFVLRWTLRRARSKDDSRSDDERRTQLKRATDLLNAVRSLKLDVRLSTAPGHDVLEKEVEGVEGQLREQVEALSNGKNPVPPYQLDELDRRVESLKARADGRPDPYPAGAAPAPGQSPYAREADERFGRSQEQPPYYPQQQPPVIVQQGGGFGGGMGGLLTGVLLGEALNSGRDRVVERDVIVDDEEARRRAAGGDNGGLDFGRGSNDWNDGGGGGGGVDMGSNDDSGGWSDT